MTEQRKRGRPTEAAKDVRIYARMTEQEKRRFMALGGSKWLRKQIADSDVREVTSAAPERQATDGGRNPRYEGLFDGETEEHRAIRRAAYCLSESGQHYVSNNEKYALAGELRALLATAQPAADGEREAFEAWVFSSSSDDCPGGIAWGAWQARAAISAPIHGEQATFKLGDPVRKTKGSQWSGRVVGTYSTALTPEGYAVESSTEIGSVQIYPAAAIELATPSAGSQGGDV